MNKMYFGKTGILNNFIAGSLDSKDELEIVSVKKLDVLLKDECRVVFAGRYLTKEFLDLVSISNKKVDVLYLSTFSGNDFRDYYQQLKFEDERRIFALSGDVLRIPFIIDWIPDRLAKEFSSESTGYFIYHVSKDSVSCAINKYFRSGFVESLEPEKKHVSLSLREKISWCIFRNLYTYLNKRKTSKYAYYSVKLAEKIAHKLFFMSGVSSVYVAKVR